MTTTILLIILAVAVVIFGFGLIQYSTFRNEEKKRQWELKREIHEELDAEIEVGELLRTIDYDYPNFHLPMHCFKCKLADDHMTLLEHEAAKWLKPEELDSVKWLPADEEIIEELKY